MIAFLSHCPTCTCECTHWGGNIIVIGGFYDDTPVVRLDMRMAPLRFDPPASTYLVDGWLIELQQTPRRMKRPFPHHQPGPRRCHATARQRHRHLSRIRRLWRGRKSSSRSGATAVSSTRSRNGAAAGRVTVRSLWS